MSWLESDVGAVNRSINAPATHSDAGRRAVIGGAAASTGAAETSTIPTKFLCHVRVVVAHALPVCGTVRPVVDSAVVHNATSAGRPHAQISAAETASKCCIRGAATGGMSAEVLQIA
jgi:hypothetical protein